MVAKRLASGTCAYYWQAPGSARARGFKVESEALGTSYGEAIMRAGALNAALDAWRVGDEHGGKIAGTVAWMLAVYRSSSSFLDFVGERARAEDYRHMNIIEELKLKNGQKFGDLPLMTITEAAADKLYERLRVSLKPNDKGFRNRQSEMEIGILKKAWNSVKRAHPEHFPKTNGNPFVGVKFKRREKESKEAATWPEVVALAAQLKADGHPHLGAAVLIAYEWVQRPEGIILEGLPTWTDYVPGVSIRIEHPKRHEVITLALGQDGQRFFPEIEAYLAALPKLGVPIVMMPAQRGRNRPYKMRRAHSLVAQARKAAGLPAHVTLAACRHGGMTEMGDAGLTEPQIRSVSTHKSVAIWVYVKKTARQRLAAVKLRREHREAGFSE